MCHMGMIFRVCFLFQPFRSLADRRAASPRALDHSSMPKENKCLRELADAIITAYTSGTEVGELLRRFERLANEELCVYCRESDSRSSFVNLNALRACGTKFMGLLQKPDVKVSQQDQWNEHWTAQRQHHAQFFRILYVCLMSSLLSASETSGAQFPKTNMLTNLAAYQLELAGAHTTERER